MKIIEITGARLHNLKNFDVSIPKDILVVVTGVSGAGKSSLVFDYLNEVVWDGAQILPAQWVTDTITEHTPGYGYQWWL